MRDELAPPQSRAPALSDATDAAIRRALNAEPMNRPASCDEFVASLQTAGNPPGAAPAPVAELPVADPTVADPTADAMRSDASAAKEAAPPSAEASEGSGWLWLVAAASATAFLAGLYFLWRL